MSPVLLLKKAWPTLVIALTTASSAAAFNTNVNDANMELGVDRKLVEFGIPIGQVLFMPGLFATLFVAEACLAESCGLTITVPWLIIGFVTNYLVSTACPPVPGTGMMCFSVVFAQLGIPAEMMGIALAIDMITDFPTTAVTVGCAIISLQTGGLGYL